MIATREHREVLLGGLSAKGFDLERARAAGQLAVLDAHDTLGRLGVATERDWERFQEVVGGVIARSIAGSATGRVRAYGEMVDVLWRQGEQQAALRLEEFWNRLIQQHAFSLFCAYVMGNFYRESHAEPFRHVCDLHTQILPAEPDAHGLRETAMLQQRARALETELVHRRELEEALRTARSQAEMASRAKDEFLAMLGHELRNPLSPILTALELMKLRGDGETTREQEVIERQTRHLIRLVDDLLDVSRVSRGVLELRRQRVDIRDVLSKAAEIASPVLEQRQHHFTVKAPPRGLMLHADEARIAQVIANLLTNAARYTPPGGNISVSASHDASEVVVEVRDDGIGIGPDLLPRVFDLFVQGRQSVDRASGGLGIGLALVKSLVGLHGGTVTAQSDGPGKGSLFTVRLPALETPRFADVGDTHPKPRAAPRSRRVLAVDDNDDALQMLAEILRAAGHEVRPVNDGPAALEVAKEFRPQVAILDIGLPAMDGYELATRLRAQMGSETPRLIALSGYGQEADRAQSAAAGFARHLVKPLELAELLATIDADA